MKKPEIQYEIVDTLDRVSDVVLYAKQTGVFCFDFETKGAGGVLTKAAALDKKTNLPTLLSISVQAGYAYIIPMFHDESPFNEDEIITIFFLLSEVMESTLIRKVNHNINFDLFIGYRYGWTTVNGVCYDTLKMHDQFDENAGHALTKDLVPYYFPSFVGYGDDVDYNGGLEQLAKYAAGDTILTLALFYMFEDWATDEPAMYRIIRNIDNPLIKAILKAETFGMTLDLHNLDKFVIETDEAIQVMETKLRKTKYVVKFEKYLFKKAKKAEIKRLRALYKEYCTKYSADSRHALNQLERIAELESGIKQPRKPINFRSSKDMPEFLYSKKGLNLPPKEDKGKLIYTTDKRYIAKLNHPFIKKLINLRKLKGVQATFLRGLRSKSKDGRLHPSINSAGTVTGRISMADPNLMNMPRKLESEVPAIETAFKRVKQSIVPSGINRRITQADFSQMELRLVANFSEDEVMIDTYLKGIDIHTKTGAMIAGMSMEDFVNSDQFRKGRQDAKTANFSLVYEVSLQGYIDIVFKNTGKAITKKAAKLHFDSIFKTYPKLIRWHKKAKQFAKKYGYVETWFGRKRRLPEIYSEVDWISKKALRQAINSPVQGTGGQYTLYVIGLCDICFPEDLRFVNTVHDSIMHDFDTSWDDYYKWAMVELAENPPLAHHFKKEWPAVKMKIDIEGSTESWGALQEF